MRTVLVKDLMSSPVITLSAEAPLPAVEDLMLFEHVRHLPVIDRDRRVVGLVSHRDLLRAQISSLAEIDAAKRRARQADVRATAIMTTDVWTVGPEVTASIAGHMILGNRIGCLPVVDSDGRLVGILTERDFVRYALAAIDAGLSAA